MERWKDIDGFPGYQVSSTGRVKSRVNNRHGLGDEYHELKPFIGDRGYTSVHLGRKANQRVNRLVAKAFIPNPNNYPIVRHLDDNPRNNCVDNLAWGTQTDNMQDCVQHGRLVGDTRAAIESRKIKVIGTSLETGEVRYFDSLSDAARNLGLWVQHISSVARGKLRQTGGWAFEFAER